MNSSDKMLIFSFFWINRINLFKASTNRYKGYNQWFSYFASIINIKTHPYQLKNVIISSIFDKCPDRLITSITKPYILQNILIHWICSKFFKFQHGHKLFWPPTLWRLLEAKNTQQRPKMAWRSRFIEKSCSTTLKPTWWV